MNFLRGFVEDRNGASNLEIIVWFSVVLVIATGLFLFRDAIMGFISDTITRVQNFQRPTAN
jgi:hypothetical protein